MLKISIVPFEESDISSAVSLEKLCFSEPWSESSFESSLNNNCSHFFVAKLCDEFVGYAGMYAVLREGYVCNIAVHEKYRGQGVGTALTKKILDCAKELSLDFLSLEVRKSNLKAVKIYKNCGFKEVGLRKKFYKAPEEDALIMTFDFI